MAARREEDFFWDGVDRGELLAQECSACAALRHPPLPRCGECGSPQWQARRLSGRGTIMASIESVHPGRRDEQPACVALIDLAEGLRMAATVRDGENAVNGAPVSVEFGEEDGQRLPYFRTTGSAA